MRGSVRTDFRQRPVWQCLGSFPIFVVLRSVAQVLEAWDRFPFLLFYDQLHTETTEKKDAYEKELMENQFVSLEEYEEQLGKCFKLGMKDFSIASGS